MKRRYLMRCYKVLMILAMVFSYGAPALAQPSVTLPYTFSDGTPAKASEVNADFTALKEALPGVGYANIAANNVTIGPTTTITVGSLTINAPRDGYIVLTFTGNLQGYLASVAPKYFGMIGFGSSSSGSSGLLSNSYQYGVPYTDANNGVTALIPAFSYTQVYTVWKGNTTFTAVLYNGRDVNVTVSVRGSLIAQFFPTKY
jgi:hypothetical protein